MHPGTPFATGRLFATNPVTAIPRWLAPWNPRWNDTTSPRPVAVSHNLIAASTVLTSTKLPDASSTEIGICRGYTRALDSRRA